MNSTENEELTYGAISARDLGALHATISYSGIGVYRDAVERLVTDELSRIVEPVLDAMGVTYHEIEGQADVGKIAPAIDAAYAQMRPVVLLIGRTPS